MGSHLESLCIQLVSLYEAYEATWRIPSPIKYDACPLQCPPLPVSLIVCQYTVILLGG